MHERLRPNDNDKAKLITRALVLPVNAEVQTSRRQPAGRPRHAADLGPHQRVFDRSASRVRADARRRAARVLDPLNSVPLQKLEEPTTTPADSRRKSFQGTLLPALPGLLKFEVSVDELERENHSADAPTIRKRSQIELIRAHEHPTLQTDSLTSMVEGYPVTIDDRAVTIDLGAKIADLMVNVIE